MSRLADMSLEAIGWGAVGYGVGFLYSAMHNSGLKIPVIEAKIGGLVVAISAAVYSIFVALIKDLNVDYASLKKFRLLGETVLASITIVAYRHFNLIGEVGTGVILAGMGVNILMNL